MNTSNPNERLIKFLQATPDQVIAIDRILEAQEETQPALPTVTGAGGFDEIERRLSLVLDSLLNAIEAYRDQKKGRGV